MTTPLASKTTVSSRNKMAPPASIGPGASRRNNNTNSTNNPLTRLRPRATLRPPATRSELTTTSTATTSSRIALPRSRLSKNATRETTPPKAQPPAQISATPASRNTHITNTVSRLTTLNGTRYTPGPGRGMMNTPAGCAIPSFANSRSSSKVSSISSSVTRQSSLINAQATVRKQPYASNYIPDTNSVRKGLAKFSNPIECQRQFQALNSEIRELKEISDNKQKKIDGLQEQLQKFLNTVVGYATVVQYFAKKLKIDSNPDLETECGQLKTKIRTLMANETEYENKLQAIVSECESHLQAEKDLRASLTHDYERAKTNHSTELERLKEEQRTELLRRDEAYEAIKSDLEYRISNLETDLNTRTKDLSELRKEYETLNSNFNKLEDSLTKDKDARVKYFQDKVNQLQKDVDSLNSVLEMRTETIHALGKDSILLGEVQSQLASSRDQNKALRQQTESLQAALENKRLQFENLLADHEKISQELKRERKERRRMTMRSEQLEFVLNESCSNENNVTVIDSSSVET